MNSTKKIFITLLLVVLLPAVFYSVYEISSLNDTEQMVSQMYQRQLDAVLFSVNQYVLDVASSWATQIENELPRNRFDRLLQSNPSIVSVVVADTSLRAMVTLPSARSDHGKKLAEQKETIDRLIRYQSVSYRKLEPVVESDSTFIILFAPASSPSQIVGIVVNNDRFINDVIGKKLSDIAQNEFILAVDKRSRGTTVFATAKTGERQFTQSRQLWIFPDHIVKIRLRGTTIEESAADRFRQNIALILIMDAVVIIGAWFVYRTIKREMELVAMKSDFVSNVSHELRTPLSLIRMFAETLEMKRVPTEKKKQEYYGIILHETERLTRLINNILNFSRMESHTRKYQFTVTSVNDIITSVLSIYAYQLEQMKCTVQRELSATLPPISADEEALAEALHNLIDNAIKYSRDDKFLRIATWHNAKHIMIEVEDHGIGIPEEHHRKIFDKFYRVSHGLVHSAKGSGLGLAIVQHIVQSHGGSISMKSKPGTGSIFTIVLPIVRT